MEGGVGSRRKADRRLPHRTFVADEVRPMLSMVVPAYNEEGRLGETLPAMWDYLRAHHPAFELIVVDDGSTDATAKVVEVFGAEHPGVILVSYRPNRGKGYAVRVGVQKARGELVLFTDADLATPLEELEALLAGLRDGHDIAIASRAIPGAQRVVRQPWYRELAGRCFNLMVQILAVPGIRDTQCGFKLFPGPVAQDVCSRYEEDGFSFDIEVLHIARRLGYRIVEVPVRWMHRDGSKVKMSRDVPRMFLALLRIKGRHRRLRPHLRERTKAGAGVRR